MENPKWRNSRSLSLSDVAHKTVAPVIFYRDLSLSLPLTRAYAVIENTRGNKGPTGRKCTGIRKWLEMIRAAMQVPGQVVPELNDSSRRDGGSRRNGRTTSDTGRSWRSQGVEVGSRFAAERKRLMYDRRKKERSQQSRTTGGVIPGWTIAPRNKYCSPEKLSIGYGIGCSG